MSAFQNTVFFIKALKLFDVIKKTALRGKNTTVCGLTVLIVALNKGIEAV